MNNSHYTFLIAFSIFVLWLFILALKKCTHGCAFHLTRWLTPLGMFVWGDVLILSVFWLLVAVVTLVLHQWVFFLMITSLFWLVRSSGETLYWFLQQFATTKRDKPESLLGYRLVKNESIWFIYQVLWQCLTVVFLVLSIYFIRSWLLSM